jgi:hypothetical protein
MEQILKSAEKNEIADIDKAILNRESPSIYNSHPLLRERLAYIENFESSGARAVQQETFKSIFENLGEISKNMSGLYSYYISALIDYNFDNKTSTEQFQKNDPKNSLSASEENILRERFKHLPDRELIEIANGKYYPLSKGVAKALAKEELSRRSHN